MEVDDTEMEKKIEVLYQRIVNMTVLRPYWVVCPVGFHNSTHQIDPNRSSLKSYGVSHRAKNATPKEELWTQPRYFTVV